MSGNLGMEQVFGAGGLLSQALPRYEHRPEQLALARAVEEAFSERSYLVAEAGTGIGKTLAYLAPAVLSGRKTVVSTATKTLQDQLFFKDLPVLRDALGLKLAAAYVKGRSNYLCLHRYESFSRAPAFPSREEAGLWPLLQAWAERTETGDRAEVALPDTFGAWRELSTTSETCLGQRCPSYQTCFVTRMRRRAEEADVVVVNHPLFFADLSLRTGRGSGEGVLPRYEAVVFDEAHGLEDAATSFFGYGVSSFRLEELSRDAQAALPATDDRAGMLSALALKVRSEGEVFFKAVPGLVGLSGNELSARLTPGSLGRLHGKADEVMHGLTALASYAAGAEEPEVEALARRSSDLAAELDFIRKAESEEHVFWAEGRGRGVFLRAAPIEVSGELRSRLYGKVDTVVFTSATLRTPTGFKFFVDRMGLMDDEGRAVAPLRQLALPSSFDFRSQAALYVPTHLPEPSAPDFVEAAAEELLSLVELTGGRAFALFTSLRNMERAHALLKDRLPCQALLQGERPKAALLEAFRAAPSVLFASQSFWEGVDVQGEALSLVVMDKLPFASPGDPLTAARVDRLKARGGEPFSAYQVPDAAIRLRQGFGRLIRSRQDRGMVAILDRRLVTKRYGSDFLRSLPPVPRFSDTRALAAWWRVNGWSRGGESAQPAAHPDGEREAG